MLKIKDIPDGAILWKGDTVIGIKGSTLPETFGEYICVKIPGNSFDYELEDQEFSEEDAAFIAGAEIDWDEDFEEPEDDIWDTRTDNTENETREIADPFGGFNWPEMDELPDSDDPDYDEMAKAYEEEQAEDPTPADWDDPNRFTEAVEKLEENESEVECKCCFELFPKESCVKTDKGYVCQKCNQELHSHQGTNLDLIDKDPFDLDYDDPRDPDEEPEEEIKEEPLDADEMRKHEKVIEEDLKKDLKVITDFSSYKPWSGAVDTYELIRDANKLDELEAYLEECYPEGIDETQLNDILWFDSDTVLSYLGLGDVEAEEDEFDESLTFEALDEYNSDVKSVYHYNCDPSGLEGDVEATSEKEAYRKVEDILAAAGIYVPDEIIDIQLASETLEEGIFDKGHIKDINKACSIFRIYTRTRGNEWPTKYDEVNDLNNAIKVAQDNSKREYTSTKIVAVLTPSDKRDLLVYENGKELTNNLKKVATVLKNNKAADDTNASIARTQGDDAPAPAPAPEKKPEEDEDEKEYIENAKKELIAIEWGKKKIDPKEFENPNKLNNYIKIAKTNPEKYGQALKGLEALQTKPSGEAPVEEKPAEEAAPVEEPVSAPKTVKRDELKKVIKDKVTGVSGKPLADSTVEKVLNVLKDSGIVTEGLKEHINDRPADIESDQELQGTDNAVVDCKKYTLVAHSEDEKPVDCKLEKPALEEPLAGEQVDAKLYEDTPTDGYSKHKEKVKPDPEEKKSSKEEEDRPIKEAKEDNFEDKLVAEYHKRLDKYAPKFGFANGEELDAAMENDPDLYQEVIEFDDGDNFLDLYLNWWPNEKGFAAEDEYYHEPLKDLLADCLNECLKEETTEQPKEKPWMWQQGEDGEPEFIGWAVNENALTDKLVKNHMSDYIYENTYIDELDEETYKYMREQGDLSEDEIKELDDYFGLEESLVEAKKNDEEELPPDPGAVKVEVHSTLNNLVADEIEAIDGYEEAKADILEQPIEHKDEIISTIDHIKDEEKEHIDELIQATSEIPFEGEAKSFDERKEEVSPADIIPEEEQAALESGEAHYDEEGNVEEALTEEKAKPAGDKEADYKAALKLAAAHNKPVIYGYSNKSYNGKYFTLDDPIVCDNVFDETKKFKQQFKSCGTTYVAYPDDYEGLKESYRFSPEEQEQYNCDEDGCYEENGRWGRLVKCGWCGDFFDDDECRFEADFGWLCDRCQDELVYHGGPLTFIEPAPRSCDEEDELEANLQKKE